MVARTPLAILADSDGYGSTQATADSAGGSGRPEYQLQLFSAAEITKWVNYCALQFSEAMTTPAGANAGYNDNTFTDHLQSYITWTTTNGTMDGIVDTRYKSGLSASGVSSPPSEATTEEPQLETQTYDQLNWTNSGTNQYGAKPTYYAPVYYEAGRMQAFSEDEFFDTFIDPAIDLLTDGNARRGTFEITTTYPSNSSANDYRGIRDTAGNSYCFIDTSAQVANYVNTSIPSAGNYLDLHQSVTYYCVVRVEPGAEISGTTGKRNMFYQDGNGDLKPLTEAMISPYMQWAMAEYTRDVAGNAGNRIGYTTGSTPAGATNVNNKGTGMDNTVIASTTGNYQTYQAGADDYRAQEFPDGTPTVATTTFLRIYRY